MGFEKTLVSFKLPRFDSISSQFIKTVLLRYFFCSFTAITGLQLRQCAIKPMSSLDAIACFFKLHFRSWGNFQGQQINFREEKKKDKKFLQETIIN